MLITTTDTIAGKQLEVLGMVRGNVVVTKNVVRDTMAGLRSVVGGEIKSYTDMTSDARQIAEERMVDQATQLRADAVVGMRFASETVMAGSIEMLAYGTAVRFV